VISGVQILSRVIAQQKLGGEVIRKEPDIVEEIETDVGESHAQMSSGEVEELKMLYRK